MILSDRIVRLALIGDPVAHSVSPSMHAAFLRERGIDGSYDAVRVGAGDTRRALLRLRKAGYLGVNVTTPLKEEAYESCDIYDESARSARAVNTIVLGERLVGSNTDGAGAIHAVRTALGGVDQSWVLVLGLGPTARASIVALKNAGAHVVIWSRDPAKAHVLAERFGVRVWESSLRVDVALSTLPPGVDVPREARTALATCLVIIDANYGARATLAAQLDRPTLDGTAMLAGSGRESFELWMRALSGANIR